MIHIRTTRRDILYMPRGFPDRMLNSDSDTQCSFLLVLLFKATTPSDCHSITVVRTPHAPDTLVDTRYGFVDFLDLLSAGVSQ